MRDAIHSFVDTAIIAQFEQLGRLRQQIGSLRQSGGDESYISDLEQQAEALDRYNSHALYNTIWQPFESLLEGVTTVYYSPSGLLNKVSLTRYRDRGKRKLRSG